MLRKLRVVPVLLMIVSLMATPLAAQQSKAVQTMAKILLSMNHFPSDADKQALKQLADDKATTAPERVLVSALAGIQHTLSAGDKAKVEAVLKDPAASEGAKTIATVLSKLNHTASDADKAALKKLVS